MRLAYLCNVYPAVSHSFVRREIEGVEAAGHTVARFTIRPSAADLRDEADVREAAVTQSVLGQGIGKLLLAAVLNLCTRPARTVAALASAYQLSGPGLKAKARHAAYWLEAAWLLRRLDQLGIQHLHIHFGTNPTAVGAIVRAWGGPPFSFTVHGPDEFDAPKSLKLSEKIRRATLVAAISSFGRSQLMRWSEPSQWTKIAVVRCGVDQGFLDGSPPPMPASSTEFVCVARLSPQKGLPLLISACAELRRRGEKFTVTIVGGGELRTSIESEIRERNLKDVITLAGARSAAEIRECLARARAFVLPSFAEGLPVVLMEALALGRPVIATSIAGIPELVDESCGWLIPAGSVDALTQAMRSALTAGSAELESKGAAGRARVAEMHDSRKNAEQLAGLIRHN